MSNAAPYEVLASGDITLYVAPVATAFPDVDLEPPAPWVKVGTNGALNYTEDGVRVAHPQTVQRWKALGSNAPRKIFRTDEGLEISLVMADMTLEQYAHALGGNAVTDTPAGSGTPGFKEVNIERGSSVYQRALLLRFPSPEMAEGNAQYCVPIAFEGGSPEVVFQKNEPAGLALNWIAVPDTTQTAGKQLGWIQVQDADALS